MTPRRKTGFLEIHMSSPGMCEVDTIYDTDTFGFSVTDTLGVVGGGGQELARALSEWKLLTGWFGSSRERRGTVHFPETVDLPGVYSISQNYPNPFNPTTEIIYTIPEDEREGVGVVIMVYNIRGQLIKRFDEGVRLPGRYSIIWDGRNDSGGKVSSGIYFYQIRAGDYTTTRKMVMMK